MKRLSVALFLFFFTGHFLLLGFQEAMKQSEEYNIESPWFADSKETCSLEADLHMNNMKEVSFKMILKTQNHSTWVPMSSLGGASRRSVLDFTII